MLLDLFITHYNEPWDVGQMGFRMLLSQQCVDWSQVNVTLVHDGTPCYPDKWFQDFPFEVHQVSIPHGGIAAARNWCIDHSTADWIKWNDFDDWFSNVYSLKNILQCLGNSDDFDLLWFEVYAQMNGKVYIKKERDPVVLHGKAFRRQFLIDHGIRFQEDLTWCEDSAFLALMEMEIDVKRIGQIVCECPIYTWVHRPGSLCNRPEIKFSNLKSFFRRHRYVADEFLKHGCIDEYNTMIARIMCDSYYTLCVTDLDEDTSEHERNVWEYFKEHRDEFLKVSNKNFDAVVAATNRENENCNITKQDVVDWIKRLRIKYEGEGQ